MINKDHVQYPKDTVANLHSGPRPTKQGRGIKGSRAGMQARGKPPLHTNWVQYKQDGGSELRQKGGDYSGDYRGRSHDLRGHATLGTH